MNPSDDLEMIADLCHEQWSNWMRYLFQKGTHNPDGTFTIAKEAVDRWRRQMDTPYRKLNESEKESDRTEARKFKNLLAPVDGIAYTDYDDASEDDDWSGSALLDNDYD